MAVETDQPSRSSVKSGLVWMFSGQGVLSALQIVVLMVLARLLTPAEFGVATIFLAVAQVCGHLSTLGFGPALVQRQEIGPLHVRTALGISLLGGLLSGSAMYGLRDPLLRWFQVSADQAMPWLFLPLCCVSGVHMVLRSLMQKSGQYRWIAAVETGSFVLAYATPAIVLASLRWGASSVIIAFILNLALNSLVFALILRPPAPTRIHLASVRDLSRTGLGFGLSEFVSIASQSLDKLMVGGLLGPSAVGLYGRASSLMLAAVHLLSAPMDAVLFPAFSRAQRSPPMLRDLLLKTNTLTLLLCLPVALLMLCAPEGIIVLMLGPAWLEASPLLGIFGLLLLTRALGRAADFILRARGLVYRRLALSVTFCVLMLALVATGASFGLVGVAVGVTLAFLFHGILLLRIALREIDARWVDYLGWVGCPLSWAAAVAASGFLLRHAWPGPPVHPVLHLASIAILIGGCLALPLWFRPAIVFGRQGHLAQAFVMDLTQRIRHRLAVFVGRRF